MLTFILDRLSPSRHRFDLEYRALFGSGNTGWKAVGWAL